MGYGLNLHLVATDVPIDRMKVKQQRIQHFSSALPRVDHIAFESSDLTAVRNILDAEKVFYKYEINSKSGIHQVFFFDPDGNVLEISNCFPPVGRTVCTNDTLCKNEYPGNEATNV